MIATSYWPPGPDRQANTAPLLDRAEVEECRHLLGEAQTAAMVTEIEGYGCTVADELAAQREFELWGCNPFEEG